MKIKYLALALSLLIGTDAFCDYYMDEKGQLKGLIQKNGENGFSILNENGQLEGFIQENGENNYIYLDKNGYLKGFYQIEE